MKRNDIIKVFNQWKKDPRLHNEILATGCMERTRIICRDLMDKGIECGFLYMPQEEKGDESVSCEAILKTGKKYCFHWMRHVVPFVWDEEGKIVVLDVCLMDGPEYLNEWAKHVFVNDEPVNRDNSFINSADFLHVLEYRSKNKDPWVALKSISSAYHRWAIQPNQKKSEWLKKQVSPSTILFMRKNQKSG